MTEAPCERTGKPCVWLCEEWGDCGKCWDLYCEYCGRWRDWGLEEMKESKDD